MEEVDEAGNGKIKNNGVWTNTHLNIPELIATTHQLVAFDKDDKVIKIATLNPCKIAIFEFK